ncbi:hypothetical protein B0T19DRAFT_428115 [Cercophora scortea]|uniref:Uncharacterized protein n=1 Tax=Cercophora scortea TaxID=314031 RepID=A0AAE0IFL2_9PEZI|nr:hypothetical protein B0T19DRAFT_428115 [Cercophora scortea]
MASFVDDSLQVRAVPNLESKASCKRAGKTCFHLCFCFCFCFFSSSTGSTLHLGHTRPDDSELSKRFRLPVLSPCAPTLIIASVSARHMTMRISGSWLPTKPIPHPPGLRNSAQLTVASRASKAAEGLTTDWVSLARDLSSSARDNCEPQSPGRGGLGGGRGDAGRDHS